MSLLFAATYPERTAALVLRGGFPRTMWAPDYPWGQTEEQYRRNVEAADLRLYGTRAEAEADVRKLPGWETEDAARIVDYLRWSASPGALEALARMNREIDVRDVLPAIRVPTLILHGSEDTIVPAEAARWMADRIPGARFIEVPGAAHLHFGRGTDAINAEVERFLTHLWEEGGWEQAEPDRVLATVLFTDIVDSSTRLAALGDRAWRELLERHHETVRRQLVRFRGQEVDTAGDGFFASFDGPARAVRCASAIVDDVRGLGIEVRAGLHTGECEVVDGKVAGIAVHTGARVASQAEAGEVLVSSTVKDLVAGSGIAFADRGVHELKGVPGEWQLFAVDRVTA
jgi:class 3 adenylate cyclase